MPPDDDDHSRPALEDLASAQTGVADTLSSEAAAAASAGPGISARVTAEDPAAGTRRRGPRAVRVGDTLGRYELLEEIGEGGMATVYRARDRELRREVALKVLFPHLARRDEIVRRFQREARAAAGLEHENILRIYDVGGANGSVDDEEPPYIVMELIRGRSLLGELEQRGALLSEIVACIGALLADALVAAHAAGIIHRDIKPANVMIASDGRLLLADFGVARLETEDSLVTKTGSVLGTPAYMSPEQAHGETATSRSDLYSVGASLYQLSTGALPFAGSTAKVLAQIASGAFVPPSRKRSGVGPDLSNAITSMMSTDPLARPASAKILARELRAIAAAGGLTDATAELVAYFTAPDAYLAAKTPAIVASVIAAGKQAIADAKLPRAIALADRASALAPDDPAVAALVAQITAGGRASARKRALMIGGAVLALVGGGATAWQLGMFAPAPLAIADAGLAAVAADAAVASGDAPPVADDAVVAVVDVVRDAAIGVDAPRRIVATPDARPMSVLPDAAVVAADAAIIPASPPIDAAPLLPDAPEAMTAILVANDVWCEITIDRVGYGRLLNKPLRVAPGSHVVTCAQPTTRKSWTQNVDVAAGQILTVQGHMLEIVEVTIAIEDGAEALLGPLHYKRGALAKIKAGRYEVTVPGVAKAFLDISASCTLRVRPELGCYR